jgi:hypothetical protein
MKAATDTVTGTAMARRKVRTSRRHLRPARVNLSAAGLSPNKSGRHRLATLQAVALSGLLVAASAHSQPPVQQGPGNQPPLANQLAPGMQGRQFGLRFGGGYSDNLARVSGGEQSGSYSLLGLTGQYSRNADRWNANLASDIEQRRFSDSSIDDEPYGYLTGSVELFAVPERLSWVFADDYGQARSDPFRAAGPLNREQINVFSTGPRLNMPVGARTFFQAAGTRAERSFEETNRLDSESTTYDVGISRVLNTTTDVGLTISTRETSYDVSTLDNELDSAYFSYQRRLAAGQASVALGKSRVNFGGTDDSAPYAAVTWDRDVGARSRISLSFTNELIDAGDNLRLLGGLVTNETVDEVFLTADVLEQATTSLAYSLTRDRAQITVTLSSLEAEYQNDLDFDNQRDLVAFSWARTVTPLLTVGSDLFSGKRSFDASGQEDQDRRAAIWLRRLIGSRLNMDLRLERDSRDGQGVNNYDENFVRLVFRYDFARRAPI